MDKTSPDIQSIVKTFQDESLKGMTESAYSAAREYVDSATKELADTPVIKELIQDVESHPEKLGKEIGIAVLCGVTIFAGMRIYDAYKTEKEKPFKELEKKESKTVPTLPELPETEKQDI